MDPNSIVSGVHWVCDHQELAANLLIWFAGSIGASALAWINTKYKMLPQWVTSVLHFAGCNFLHAIDPKPAVSAKE